MKKQRQQLQKQLEYHQHKNYMIDFDLESGISLPHFAVDAGVLRPEIMVSLKLAKFLAINDEYYKGKKAFDIGCGSGIQGITMSLHGAKQVVCTDIASEAINNTMKNVAQYDLEHTVSVIQSDLFKAIPEQQFDCIVFNHPFFPELIHDNTSVGKTIMDDGSLLRRFLEQAPEYMARNATIIMPFFSVAGRLNDPKNVGTEYGYTVSTIAEYPVGHGIQSETCFIYKLTM